MKLHLWIFRRSVLLKLDLGSSRNALFILLISECFLPSFSLQKVLSPESTFQSTAWMLIYESFMARFKLLLPESSRQSGWTDWVIHSIQTLNFRRLNYRLHSDSIRASFELNSEIQFKVWVSNLISSPVLSIRNRSSRQPTQFNEITEHNPLSLARLTYGSLCYLMVGNANKDIRTSG